MKTGEPVSIKEGAGAPAEVTYSFPVRFLFNLFVWGYEIEKWLSLPTERKLRGGCFCDYDFYHVKSFRGKFSSRGRWHCGRGQGHATWGLAL